jgi:hypothetical protein
MVLGALLTVAIFAMGMLFSPSLAPQQEKRGEQQAAAANSTREGVKHGFWEKTADDPVAYFTLWLVAFTGVLALSTVGLGVATIFLWRAGEKQLRLAREEFISSNRPVVRIRRVFYDTILGAEFLSHGDDVEIDLMICNVGSSNARIVDSRYRIYFFKRPKPEIRYGEFPPWRMTDEEITLASGESRIMNVRGRAVLEAPDDPDMRIVRQFGDSWAMHIVGEISYQDDMGRTRRTGFLREWKPGGAFGRIDDPDYEYED